MADRPCCAVGARPDAPEIDAALRAGGSVRHVAARFGLGRTAVSDHRGCLGLRGVFPTPPPPDATGARSGDHVAPSPLEGGRGQPPDEVSADTEPAAARTPADTGTDSADSDRGTPSKALPQPARAHATAPKNGASKGTNGAADRRVDEERITTIANMIALGAWKDHPTIVALTARWGVSADVVRRYHRMAAGVVRRNRGPQMAQLELSVAVTRKIRDDELAYAERQDAEADRCMAEARTADKAYILYQAAKAAKRLASIARGTALSAQAHLDKLTLAKPIQVLVHNVEKTPEEAGAWALVREILERLHPAALRDLEEGLDVLIDGHEPAMRAWLAERATERTLVLEEHNGVHEVAR